jgi:hypothetical protein
LFWSVDAWLAFCALFPYLDIFGDNTFSFTGSVLTVVILVPVDGPNSRCYELLAVFPSFSLSSESQQFLQGVDSLGEDLYYSSEFKRSYMKD